MENEYINIKEIAGILGVQPQSVREIMEDYPIYKITRKVALWKKTDFLKMIAERKVADNK